MTDRAIVAPHRRRHALFCVLGTGALVFLGCTADEPTGDDASTDQQTEGETSTNEPAERETSTAPAGPAVSVRWARTMSGPTNEDEFDGIAAAPDGSVYVTGKFERRVDLAGTHLTSAGAADIPVARFDSDGEALWVERFGGPGEDNLFDADATADGMVGTGWFSGTVDFGGVVLRSAGRTDCVVLSLRPDGSTRWAERFGGPGRDGCNEVSLSSDGQITTSIDTQGGWAPTGQPPLPLTAGRDTVLMRLGPDGSPRWMRTVGGAGPQRGKSIAVAPDGSTSFGGDTIGALVTSGTTTEAPASGGARDAWMSRWGHDGELQWVTVWGGPGNDLAKGVADDGRAVSIVGPFTGRITIGGTTLDAGAADDLLVAQWSPSGEPRWATSLSAPGPVPGTEVVSAADGGVLFGSRVVPGLRLGSVAGDPIAPESADGGTVLVAHYGPGGDPLLAYTIPGTANGRPDEIARVGRRVYLDVVLRGADNEVNGRPIATVGKDASVWGLDLRDAGGGRRVDE